MRLHELELTGFGPFRETQRVDFDAFSGDGVFLVSGRTGTGKSSILDGVSFALYGTVPRYDGSEKRLRSDRELVEAFLVHVREGEGATEREAELLHDVFDERARAAGDERVGAGRDASAPVGAPA